MSKPLARHKDDHDLDRMMRELDRAGDPMLAFMKKKTAVAAGKGSFIYLWSGYHRIRESFICIDVGYGNST
jgi:hypothetical protein